MSSSIQDQQQLRLTTSTPARLQPGPLSFMTVTRQQEESLISTTAIAAVEQHVASSHIECDNPENATRVRQSPHMEVTNFFFDIPGLYM